ncbi:hypothetical protein ADLECEL_13010 [Adlercreutzia equolifaciens subsp. celatus]|nr:hypothetical protein ADLECEL_13010 [Adlercreutzia equolifaciens subsp. celatus]
MTEMALLSSWKRQPAPERFRMGWRFGSVAALPMAVVASNRFTAMATAVALTFGLGLAAELKAASERSELSSDEA